MIRVSPNVTKITGTTNQILANKPYGNITLSLPQSIATTSNVTFADIIATGMLHVKNAYGTTSGTLPIEFGTSGIGLMTDGLGLYLVNAGDMAAFFGDRNQFILDSTIGFGWTGSTIGASGIIDTGFARNGAGIVEINNGTAGSFRDLYARNITLQSSGIITGSGTVPTGGTVNQVLQKNSGTNYDVGWVTPASSGGGSAVTKTIAQTTHGFAVGNLVKYTGTAYAKALADSATNSEVVGIVSAVADANNFTLMTNGYATGLTGLTAGNVYFLSPTTAGTLTTTEPSTIGQVSKPIFVADSTTSGYFNNWRGIVKTLAGTGGGGSGSIASTGDVLKGDGAGAAVAFGSSTVGTNLLGLANPGTVTFLRINADNSVTTRSAANFKTDLSLVSSDVGLGSVTNDIQTKAAIVPNTAPSAGQILVGNAGGTAYAPVTVTNATLSSAGALTAIANTALANSAITIAGTSTSLGGTISRDTITGLSGTGLVKQTGANTLAFATAGTDYLTANQSITLSGDVSGTGTTAITTAIGAGKVTYAMIQNVSATSRFLGRITAGAGSTEELTAANAKTILALTSTDVGLGSVTNNAQAFASVHPNTAPTAGQILVGNAGNTAYAPVTLTNATLASTGALTAIANAALANSAITIAGTSTSLGGSITRDTITGLSGTGLVKQTGANTLAFATAKTDYWDTTNFVQSGVTAAKGLVPAPSTTAGTTAFLCEDGIWKVPGGGGNVSNSGTPSAGQMAQWISSTSVKGVTLSGSGATMSIDTAGVLTISAIAGASLSDGGVTYAKIQNVSATSRFLGRITAAAGVVEELTAANAKTILALTSTDVGLGSVTNNVQTQAAIVPNTAPSAGQILVGNAGATAYAPQTVSGSGATITLGATGVLTISAILNGTLPSTISSKTFNTNTFGNTNTYTAKDGNFTLQNSTTTTKVAVFDLSNITAATSRTINIPDANSTTIQSDTGATNNFLTAVSAQGVISKAQPTFSNLGGNYTLAQGPSVTAAKLLGRTDASAGIPQEITLGTNLSISGTTLNATGGGGTPGGSNTQIQFNDSSAFGGDTDFTWNKTSNLLTIAGQETISFSNTDYTNTAGANSHILLNNPSSSGQTAVCSYVNGVLSAKWRSDYGGNISWVSAGTAANTGHHFFLGGDYGVGLDAMYLSYSETALQLPNNYKFAWSAGSGSPALASGSIDTALGRNAAGIVEINNGTAGTYRDLYARNITLQSSGIITGSGTIPTGGTTNQVLAKNSATNYDVGWVTPTGGAGGSPGGSTTQFQYNNAGAFGGISSLIYDGTIPATATLALAANTYGDAFLLQNTTAATTGNQRFSPGIQFIGQGFAAGSTNLSQTYKHRIYELPRTAANPNTSASALVIEANPNGAGWTEVARFDTESGFSTNANITAGNALVAPSLGTSGQGVFINEAYGGIMLNATTGIGWNGSVWYNPQDIRIQRNASGVLEVNNGTAGVFADLKAKTFTSTIAPGASTYATGILLTNPTTATSGNPQFAPLIQLTGQAWNNTAGASQTVDWRVVNETQSNGFYTIGDLIFQCRENAGTWNTHMRLSRHGGGGLNIPQVIFPAGDVTAPAVALADSSVGIYASGGPDISFAGWNTWTGTIKSTAMMINDTAVYRWNTADTAIGRNAAGVVEINNTTAGTYRDLKLRSLILSGGTTITVSAPSSSTGLFLKDDGTWASAGGGGGTPGNPTAAVGLTAINGSASTFMRSDAAPILDQTITPTWTGQHIWGATRSITSATNAEWSDLKIGGSTTTITGTTTIAGTTPGFSDVYVGQPTLTDSSTVTVTNASTMYLAGAPLQAGSVTITNPYAFWVAGGAVRLDGNLISSATRSIASATNAEWSDVKIGGQTTTMTGTTTPIAGTTPAFADVYIGQPTLTTPPPAITATNAATFYIQGQPLVAASMSITNPYAVWVDAGVVRLDGGLGVGVTTQVATGVIDASVGFRVAGAATSGNVLKGDGTNFIPGAPPRSFSITVENPSAAENIAFGFTTTALTITKVHAVVKGSTPSVTYNIGYGTSVATLTNVTTTPAATTNATTGADATLNNTSIPANGHLVFTTSAQTGTVTWIHVTVECL